MALLLAALLVLRRDAINLHSDEGSASRSHATAMPARDANNQTVASVASNTPPPRFNVSAGPHQEPKAFNQYLSNRNSGRGFGIEDIYAKEKRSPVWAEKMEDRFNDRFNDVALNRLGLKSVKPEKIECKESSCRLEISYSKADLDYVRSQPGASKYDPVSFIAAQTGQWASTTYREPLKPGELTDPSTWFARIGADGRYYVNMITVFGPGDVDPDKYNEATEQAHAEHLRSKK